MCASCTRQSRLWPRFRISPASPSLLLASHSWSCNVLQVMHSRFPLAYLSTGVLIFSTRSPCLPPTSCFDIAPAVVWSASTVSSLPHSRSGSSLLTYYCQCIVWHKSIRVVPCCCEPGFTTAAVESRNRSRETDQSQGRQPKRL